jgi:stage III sporulation protein AA
MEIRIRIDKKIMVRAINGVHFLEIVADSDLINNIIACATKNSLYAYENEISNGYIGYKNGIRIGIVGKGNISEASSIAYKSFYSLCIRIPHQIFGLKKEINKIINNFENTLIVSPPGCGKTTLCREMARILSNRYDTLVIDERYELCGESLDLKTGLQCDIISGIPKNLVYQNIIRTMSPEIVVCDELFSSEDVEAMYRIVLSGVKCLATFHAKNMDLVPKKIRSLFYYYIVINSIPTVGSIQSITRREDV